MRQNYKPTLAYHGQSGDEVTFTRFRILEELTRLPKSIRRMLHYFLKYLSNSEGSAFQDFPAEVAYQTRLFTFGDAQY